MKQHVIKPLEVSFPSKDGMSGMYLFGLPNYMITTLPVLLH